MLAYLRLLRIDYIEEKLIKYKDDIDISTIEAFYYITKKVAHISYNIKKKNIIFLG